MTSRNQSLPGSQQGDPGYEVGVDPYGAKETIFYDIFETYASLRAGSLGEREPARIPITFTCMRPIFGRRALIG